MERRRNRILLYIAIIVAVLWTLSPIYWTLIVSVHLESQMFTSRPPLVPVNATDYFYRQALGLPVPSGVVRTGISSTAHLGLALSRGFRNSLIVATATSIITIAVASLSAYIFSRLKFRFKNGLLLVLLSAQTLPPIAVIVPYFILFKNSGLLGSLWGLIIVYLSLLIPLTTWVLMSFFATLPIDVERQARVDGCSRLGVLRRIIFPLAAPGIFAGFILAFLFSYNEFIYALILTSGSSAETIPLAVTVLFLQETTFPQLAAVVVVTLIPVFILAFIFQRYITQLRIVDPVSVIVR